MINETNNEDESKITQRVWRFSGFDLEGNIIAFEFPGPEGATISTPYHQIAIIGRDRKNCRYVIPHNTVSRQHAGLKFIPDYGLAICDLNSANGTFLNGRKLDQEYQIIKKGSEIRIANFSLIISICR